jgi:NAD(P) transhydrogenase
MRRLVARSNGVKSIFGQQARIITSGGYQPSRQLLLSGTTRSLQHSNTFFGSSVRVVSRSFADIPAGSNSAPQVVNNNKVDERKQDEEPSTQIGSDWPEFDLVVIGSGPAGQKAAIQSAKLGKRVALVDAQQMLGGICLNTGTIPSKTLREAILYLSGFRQRFFYGKSYTVKENWTFQDLSIRMNSVIKREKEVISHQLSRNHVQHIKGVASFADPHTLSISDGSGKKGYVRGKYILIACGTRPAHDPHIPCDGRYIYDADQILNIKDLPRNLIVVGAGVIGIEYAAMLGALANVQVTVIDQRPTLLDFVDQEIVDNLTFHMRESKAKFRLGEKVKTVKIDHNTKRVVAELESGKRVIGDALLYAVGRQCNSDTLNLKAADIIADSRGRLKVNENYQTNQPHIYAAGDVIGFPSLASSSMLQGRLAVCHMFGQKYTRLSPSLIPFGIYSIPEISMVGQTEQELTKANIPYEYGVSRYSELAKGMMQGDEIGGMLKILFHLETHKVLGVHAIGENATEIIHIGQAALAMGATIKYFVETVFNFPTFAEAYQVAALDGYNKVLSA